jgi:hypothetical protein
MVTREVGERVVAALGGEVVYVVEFAVEVLGV